MSILFKVCVIQFTARGLIVQPSLKNLTFNRCRHRSCSERSPDVRVSRPGHVQPAGERVWAELHRHVQQLPVGLSERGRDDAAVHHSLRLPRWVAKIISANLFNKGEYLHVGACISGIGGHTVWPWGLKFGMKDNINSRKVKAYLWGGEYPHSQGPGAPIAQMVHFFEKFIKQWIARFSCGFGGCSALRLCCWPQQWVTPARGSSVAEWNSNTG